VATICHQSGARPEAAGASERMLENQMLDQKLVVVLLLLNFFIALDCVDHELFCRKDMSSVHFLKSYLHRRFAFLCSVLSLILF
jgi:hypothetical protein